MIKRIVLLSAFLLFLFSCKKQKSPNSVKKLPVDYHGVSYSNGIVNAHIEIHYAYDENHNLISLTKNYDYENGGSYHYRYEYTYADEEKGLPSKYDKYLNGSLTSHRLYFFTNERLIKTEDWNADMNVLLYTNNFEYDDNGKLSRRRFINSRLGIDETDIFTYEGDNLSHVENYNTEDMQNPQFEYFYDEYDNHPVATKDINSHLWPSLRKNNYRHYKRILYSNGQTTVTELFYELEYDEDGYPVRITQRNEEGEITYEMEIEYMEVP